MGRTPKPSTRVNLDFIWMGLLKIKLYYDFIVIPKLNLPKTISRISNNTKNFTTSIISLV